MVDYRKSAHTIFDIRYHIVWCPKYRYDILKGDVGLRVREIIREVCRTNDVEILSGHISKDHVHVYISVPPKLSVSKIVQYIKGKTSRKLLMEFPRLKKRYWGQHLWARGYFVATVGEISDKLIRDYIDSQGKNHHQDDFKVD